MERREAGHLRGAPPVVNEGQDIGHCILDVDHAGHGGDGLGLCVWMVGRGAG